MKKYSFMFNFKLFMYCRISQRWLFSSVIDIEMGNSTIQDVCKCVDMVDSIQPTSISIDTFYKSLSFYKVLSHQMVFFECLLSKSQRPFQFILTFCIRTEKVEQK